MKSLTASKKRCIILVRGVGVMPRFTLIDFFTGYRDIHGMYWNRVQRNAKLRNITFDITKEYVWDLYVKQGKKCKLSGLDIHFGYKDITASIDRIDSSAAYVEGNIQIVHKDINWMKWDFEQDQFIQYCKLVTEKSSDS